MDVNVYTRVICPPCERRAGNGRNTSVHCQINCTRFFRPGNICPVLSNVNALKRINSLPREKEKREIEISDSRSAPFRCQTEFHELVLRWCEQMRTFCAITSALPVSRPPGNRAARSLLLLLLRFARSARRFSFVKQETHSARTV